MKSNYKKIEVQEVMFNWFIIGFIVAILGCSILILGIRHGKPLTSQDENVCINLTEPMTISEFCDWISDRQDINSMIIKERCLSAEYKNVTTSLMIELNKTTTREICGLQTRIQ
jgi:hypothetical protein